MNVQINGKSYTLPAQATVLDILSALNIPHDRQGIAVAVAANVIPRSAWASQPVQDGDVVEVVTAAQGG